MTFEVECRDEFSAWRMDRYVGRLHRRRGPTWIAYDADGMLIGKYKLRREAIAALAAGTVR